MFEFEAEVAASEYKNKLEAEAEIAHYKKLHIDSCEFPALCPTCSKYMSPERKIAELKKYLK